MIWIQDKYNNIYGNVQPTLENIIDNNHTNKITDDYVNLENNGDDSQVPTKNTDDIFVLKKIIRSKSLNDLQNIKETSNKNLNPIYYIITQKRNNKLDDINYLILVFSCISSILTGCITYRIFSKR